jgi:hypothetical protein
VPIPNIAFAIFVNRIQSIVIETKLSSESPCAVVTPLMSPSLAKIKPRLSVAAQTCVFILDMRLRNV